VILSHIVLISTIQKPRSSSKFISKMEFEVLIKPGVCTVNKEKARQNNSSSRGCIYPVHQVEERVLWEKNVVLPLNCWLYPCVHTEDRWIKVSLSASLWHFL